MHNLKIIRGLQEHPGLTEEHSVSKMALKDWDLG